MRGFRKKESVCVGCQRGISAMPSQGEERLDSGLTGILAHVVCELGMRWGDVGVGARKSVRGF